MAPAEGSMGLIFELMKPGSLCDLLHGSSEDAVSNRPDADSVLGHRSSCTACESIAI
jgi:hypothetical protein